MSRPKPASTRTDSKPPPDSEKKSLGRRLALSFISADDPELSWIEFAYKRESKPATLTRESGDKDKSFLWTAVPQAISLLFLDYVIWGKGKMSKPFSFPNAGEESLAVSIGDDRYKETGILKRLLVDLKQNGEASAQVHNALKIKLQRGTTRPQAILIKRDFLPPDCVEVFWDCRGSAPLKKLIDFRDLARLLRKSLGLAPVELLPDSQTPTIPGPVCPPENESALNIAKRAGWDSADDEWKHRLVADHSSPTTADSISPSEAAVDIHSVGGIAKAGGVQRSPLTIASASDVDSWRWTGEKLLEELIRIDHATIAGLTPEHEGTTAQWSPVFCDHPDTWRLLIDGPENIVGYWHFVPLFDHVFELAKTGRLVDSYITTDKVPAFEFASPGFYNIYFVSIAVLPAHRGLSASRQLRNSFFQNVADLAGRGMFINEICANAFTPSGVAICNSLGLKHLNTHAKHGSVYGATMIDILTNARDSQAELRRRYFAAQLGSNALRARGNPAIDELLAFVDQSSSPFEVRQILNAREIEQVVSELDIPYYQEAAWPTQRLIECWEVAPFGIQAAYDKGLLVASFGLWPITCPFAHQIENGTFHEDQLPASMLAEAQRDSIEYWYLSGIEVKVEFRGAKANALKELLSRGLRNIFYTTNVKYPCRVYASGHSNAGKQLLLRFGASLIRPADKNGAPWFRLMIQSQSHFEEVLKGRGL